VTTAELQARGMRDLERLRTANGEYAEQLVGNLAVWDAMLTARVLEQPRGERLRLLWGK
jgi:hypothetical protein